MQRQKTAVTENFKCPVMTPSCVAKSLFIFKKKQQNKTFQEFGYTKKIGLINVLFYRLGMFIACHPKKTIAVAILVAAGLGVGMIRLHTSRDFLGKLSISRLAQALILIHLHKGSLARFTNDSRSSLSVNL